MAYYEDIRQVESRLEECGIDIDNAREQINSNGPGFFINYQKLPEDVAKSAINKVRVLLYSWLKLLNVKNKYNIITKEKSITVKRKLLLENVQFGVMEK